MTDSDSATVAHGDAFELLGELPAEWADVAVIDYPWTFAHQDKTGRFEQPTADERKARSKRVEDIFDMESDSRVGAVIDEVARVVVEGGWVVCFADDRFQDVVRSALRESDLIFRRNWAWTPESMGMGYYGRVDHYPIPVATVGETDRYVTDRGTLFRVANGRDTAYPTGKPVDLYRQLLTAPVLPECGRVIEPFCGAAPAGVVAGERGCDYWGCDIDVDAVNRARDRVRHAVTYGTTASSLAEFVDESAGGVGE